MKYPHHALCLLLGLLLADGPVSAQLVHQLRITLLSTMLTDTKGEGEWGFSALVEADGHKILFDSGTDSLLVLNNAKALGIDLSDVPVLILSHSHDDHTGGWNTLHTAFKGRALDTTYVGEGFSCPGITPIIVSGAVALLIP